ncbi:hypothetical protein HMPREF0063_12687 [Aeromicrobium marinum DSM 15272]|uniref:SLH domain-containing protein n=2 Tax=Aeromicrobium marinum TaxID=219314 RepID=E2SF78_9ACTN|nr:hypothetical protein HMPREF0063_12687 [Aeromicrobium marinum DSM 15272]
MSATAAVVLCIGLLAAPAVSADEPDLSTAPDGTLTYVDPDLADESTEQVEGELTVAIVEPTEASPAGDTTYSIATAGGDEVPIDIDLPADVVSGGEITAELVDAPSSERSTLQEDEPATVASASIEPAVAAAAVATDHRYYLAIRNGSGVTAAQAESAFRAVADRWVAEAGGSIRSFSRPAGATTFYTGSCSVASPSSVWNTADNAYPGVDFGATSGNHLIVIGGVDQCDGPGVATFGVDLSSGGKVIVEFEPSINTFVGVHEVGHNLGLDHAGLQRSGCSGVCAEYGDLYSVMGLAIGGGSPAYAVPALDSAYRHQLDVDSAGEIFDAQGVTGGPVVTLRLQPRGAASGLRGVRIVTGTTEHWVEYRRKVGRDVGTVYGPGLSLYSTAYAEGVTITTRTGSDPRIRLRPDGSSGAWAPGRQYVNGAASVRVLSAGDTALVQLVGARPNGFFDVPPGPGFRNEILWLAGRGITTGYEDGSFRPSGPVLREQMAAFLYRLAGSPAVTNLPPVSPFRDVATNHVFYREIVWLSRSGITTGYADGTFRPSDPVLREQMAAFLYRYEFGSSGGPVDTDGPTFTDVRRPFVFFDQVEWLAREGISTGYDDGTFRGGQPVLREQMAAFLNRYELL